MLSGLLLKAMSEPGTVVTLNRCEGFGSMMSAAAQTLLSMVYYRDANLAIRDIKGRPRRH